MAANDLEKDQMVTDETDGKAPLFAHFTAEEEKKIIRRIDLRLVVTLGLLYGTSLMDRNNLGVAVIAGMGKQLHITSQRYSVIILIFFFSYVILQVFMTVLIRKIGPRVFLPTIVLFWGAISMCFAVATDWTHLIPLRILLGCFEAGFAPGCTYLLSCWYPRYDLHKRYSVFYLIGALASAFSGPLAYGFSLISGPQSNVKGWQWIFILQGLITCVLAIGSYLLIVDFPEKAALRSAFNFSFLKETEVAFVTARIEQDRHDVMPTEFNLVEYFQSALDLKVWGFASIAVLITTNAYAVAYFLPTILSDGLGFGLAASLCLTTPPLVAGAALMYICGYLGDKYRTRGIFLVINALIGVIGNSLLGFSHSNAVRYFGAFLASMGSSASLPCVCAYQANNIRGQWKRALCSATIVAAGGVGGIIGGTVYRSQDKPRYIPGISSSILSCVLIVIITGLLTIKFHRANKKADAGQMIIEGHKDFRYTL